MPRRTKSSALDDLFDLLKLAPAWLGPILAVAAFCLFRFVIPLLFQPKQGAFDPSSFVRSMTPMLAWLAAGAVMAMWVVAELHKFSDRRLLDRQSGTSSIRELPWREFERLVAEAYRRRGYVAAVVGNSSGDGGVDVRLSRPGETVLVQCKQWRAYTVGVKTVRELLGVVVSERATRGVVVTSGRFTREAHRFASANGQIALVEGSELAELIRGVQTVNADGGVLPEVTRVEPPVQANTSPSCPACGAEMVRRTARKGVKAGSRFWGCPKYPACRGTRA